jgi:hypothetical protein
MSIIEQIGYILLIGHGQCSQNEGTFFLDKNTKGLSCNTN